MQALNVFCGGSLIQDIPSERGISVTHNLEKPKIAFHKISVEKASPLSEAIGFGTYTVNSYHHQAVKKLGKDLSIMANSEDGIIEGFYHTSHPYLRAYQWHPERLFDTDDDNKLIFTDFINACKGMKI